MSNFNPSQSVKRNFSQMALRLNKHQSMLQTASFTWLFTYCYYDYYYDYYHVLLLLLLLLLLFSTKY